MEEVVWTVNPNNDSLPGLAAYLSDYTERFLAPTGIACRLDIGADLPPLPLSAQVRHNLLLAVKEALNNAARHAAAQTVQLEIRLDQSQLHVSIRDDGHGFNPDAPGRSGNGLPNLRSRLEAVGGCTRIVSALGEGTTVAFTLPLRGSES
jgi:signal transduction histidine kinase